MKLALSYILIYIVAKYIQIYLLPTATGIIAILMIMFSYTTTRMLPHFDDGILYSHNNKSK